MSYPLEPLPRIACFHGGGSTSAIYSIQCTQLTTLLASTFDFVFFDGPFDSPAGPGILPIFTEEEYAPYHTWFQKSSENGDARADGRGVDGSGEGGVERVLRLIQEQGEGGEWVGVMGFSQGTRVVAGLLQDQQRRAELGIPGVEGVRFRFGVLCMGSYAPMVSDVMHASYSENLIKIPTLHLHGTKDIQYEPGKQQLENYFEPASTKVWDIAYHHAMPWHRADVLRMVDLMRGLYKDTKDKA